MESDEILNQIRRCSEKKKKSLVILNELEDLNFLG